MARISLLFSLAFVLALSSLFLTVSSQTSPKTLQEDSDKVRNVLDKFFHKFDGYLGAKIHDRKLLLVAPPPTGKNAKDLSKSKFEKFISYFSGVKGHGRKLSTVALPSTRVKAADPITEEELSQSEFDKFFSYVQIFKSPSRKLYTKPPVETNIAGEKMKGSFFDFFKRFRGKGQFDASGKIKVAGKDGFKSLNRAHKNHFASMKA